MPNELIPENDLQELWQQNGRVLALRGVIKFKESIDPEMRLIHTDFIKAVMGWFEEEA